MIWAPRNLPAVLAVVLGLAQGTAASQPAAEGAPLSAIDWLSDSIQLPQDAPAAAQPPAATPPATPSVPQVMVAPLDIPVPDRVGLVASRDIGLPADLWGGSTASDLAAMVLGLPELRPPSLRRFEIALLTARFDPPIDAMADESLFLARVDRLLTLGHLGAAKALIDAAGAPAPSRFRRAFDIALLTETETQACRVIETTPDISPTFPARIFCLARNGEWEVAALTLGTAEALGILAPEEDALLLHFLDPDLFEGDPLPPLPATLSPLLFRLYEAVGERPATDGLPIAFAVADLSERVGWKTRLRAAERLAAAGAMPAERLVAMMRERAPAASGGIWDRVDAIQAMSDAMSRGDRRAVLDALPGAWAAAEAGGYTGALAPWLANALNSLDLGRQSPHAALEIALLAGDGGLAKRVATSAREDRTLLAILDGAPQDIVPASPLATAIRRALSGLPPPERDRLLMEDGRSGEALLGAMSRLADGAEGDPAAIGDALSVLTALGLDPLARRISVEIMLEASRI